MSQMDAAYQMAGRQMGMDENAQRTALQEYMSNGGVNLDPSVTAWCAAYVNASLAQAGIEGTGSNMARSFMNWGQEVADPQRGDLAVFSRGDPNGPYGHVGFFDGYNQDGTIRVLGGNQGDAVSVANYSPNELLGFRRAEGQPTNALAQPAPQPQQQQPTPPQMVATTLDASQFMAPTNALALSYNFGGRNGA